MNKTLTACLVALMILWSASAQTNATASSTYEAVCLNHSQLAEVTNAAGEIPLAQGSSVPIGKTGNVLLAVIFVNPETKTFTVVEQVTDDRYCVILLGTDFQPAVAKIQQDFQRKNDKRKL